MVPALPVDVRREIAPCSAATTLTRRSLLRSGSLATAATLAGLRPWSAAPALASAGHLQRSAYDGLVGQRFAR